jgi:hypothetical protein
VVEVEVPTVVEAVVDAVVEDDDEDDASLEASVSSSSEVTTGPHARTRQRNDGRIALGEATGSGYARCGL